MRVVRGRKVRLIPSAAVEPEVGFLSVNYLSSEKYLMVLTIWLV